MAQPDSLDHLTDGERVVFLWTRMNQMSLDVSEIRNDVRTLLDLQQQVKGVTWVGKVVVGLLALLGVSTVLQSKVSQLFTWLGR